jgi:hypothetical protein
MRRTALIGLAASALAWAGAAQAQPAPPAASGAGTTVQSVIVQGKKAEPPESFARAATKYVQSQAQPSPIGALSRWMSPICPKVFGLEPRFADMVAQRIKDVAKQAGAPLGYCDVANVEVVFRPDPQHFMDEVRDKYPDMLGYHWMAEEKALATFQEPIDVWHTTGTRDATGNTYPDDPYYSKDPPAMVNPNRRIRQRWNTSRLTVGAGASVFRFALVVVDSKQVGSEPIGRIADQIALLVLTNPKRPRTCSPLPTLLDSLDPACPASASLADFSPYDLNFIKGLYATKAEDPIDFERSDIARNIEKAGPPGAAAAQ